MCGEVLHWEGWGQWGWDTKERWRREGGGLGARVGLRRSGARCHRGHPSRFHTDCGCAIGRLRSRPPDPEAQAERDCLLVQALRRTEAHADPHRTFPTKKLSSNNTFLLENFLLEFSFRWKHFFVGKAGSPAAALPRLWLRPCTASGYNCNGVVRKASADMEMQRDPTATPHQLVFVGVHGEICGRPGMRLVGPHPTNVRCPLFRPPTNPAAPNPPFAPPPPPPGCIRRGAGGLLTGTPHPPGVSDANLSAKWEMSFLFSAKHTEFVIQCKRQHAHLALFGPIQVHAGPFRVHSGSFRFIQL